MLLGIDWVPWRSWLLWRSIYIYMHLSNLGMIIKPCDFAMTLPHACLLCVTHQTNWRHSTNQNTSFNQYKIQSISARFDQSLFLSAPIQQQQKQQQQQQQQQWYKQSVQGLTNYCCFQPSYSNNNNNNIKELELAVLLHTFSTKLSDSYSILEWNMSKMMSACMTRVTIWNLPMDEACSFNLLWLHWSLTWLCDF